MDLKSISQLALATLENSNDPIVWVDNTARICHCNSVFGPTLGYTTEELLTMTVHDINPDFKEDIWEEHWKEFRVEKHFTVETTHIRKDGSTFPVEVSANYVLNEGVEFSCIFVRNISERVRLQKKLNEYIAQVESLSSNLKEERDTLSQEINRDKAFESGIFVAPVSQKLEEQIKQVAPTLATVLITGESGTGKEITARSIHRLSQRSDHPLIKVNCAALPSNLIESELFGHVKGAFTGADTNRKGKFILADRGTLFLDEIGELPMDAQAKLLRVLQEGEVDPIGSETVVKTDVRIIAATNRNLSKEVAEGRFREDLYYRIKVFPIDVIPLRERVGDIEPLVNHFIGKHVSRMGKQVMSASQTALDLLKSYSWPGNIRELENIVTRGLVYSNYKLLNIQSQWLEESNSVNTEVVNSVSPKNVDQKNITLEDVEREHILSVWESCGKIIEGPKGAAQQLGISYNTLRRRLAKYSKYL